ncbi:MAG: hypothetical protein ABI443_10900 [Chthoniobacterales bacterium]
MLIRSARSEEARLSNNLLKTLYDRSDLIIDATFNEDCEGGMGNGPIFMGKPQVTYLKCQIHVTVNRVIKGDIHTDKPLCVSITIPLPQRDSPKAIKIGDPVFKVGKHSSSPFLRKGERYILFLEDRKKREPASYEAIGNEEVIFRNFDLWFWRLPAEDALTIQLETWKTETPSKH